MAHVCGVLTICVISGIYKILVLLFLACSRILPHTLFRGSAGVSELFGT